MRAANLGQDRYSPREAEGRLDADEAAREEDLMQAPYPPSAKILRLGDALAVVGSVLVFAFSFAPFITIRVPNLFGGGLLDDWHNAWATETFMAPLTWFVILAGLLLIAAVAVRYLTGRTPDLFGFRLTQLELGLGLFMLVVLFAMVTSEKHIIYGAGARVQGEGGASLGIGWGGILMLVGAAVAAAGAILTHLSLGPVVYPWPGAPAPHPGAAGYPPGQPYPAAPPTQQYTPPTQQSTPAAAAAEPPTQQFAPPAQPPAQPPPGGQAPPATPPPQQPS
jgi:hypothetical protein